MRVVFPRLADWTENYAAVHRDDGVVYTVHGNGQRGRRGCFHQYVPCIRPTPATDTSKAVKRGHSPRIGYPELVVWLVEQVTDDQDDATIRRLTARALATLPPPHPKPAAIRPAAIRPADPVALRDAGPAGGPSSPARIWR